MLAHTFCHLPRIGLQRECRLWSDGIHTWNDFETTNAVVRHPVQVKTLKRHLDRSRQALEQFDATYFTESMPASESWRLLYEFAGRTAYVDIETSGSLVDQGDYVTTVAVYDGREVREYIHGRNLDQFMDDLNSHDLLVTYNGKCFDIPFIESYFNQKVRAPQVDLRFIFQSLGYKGGLKGVERSLGLDRGDLDGLDGYFAVILWREYVEKGSEYALDTLVAYNVEDTVNLEQLAAIAYNLKVRETPFADVREMPVSKPVVASSRQPHMPTIDQIRRRYRAWE